MSINTSLTAVADSIRAKTGTTEKMTIAEMPTLINGIETGGQGGIDGTTGVVLDLTEIVASQFQNGAGLDGIKTVVLPNVVTIASMAFLNATEIETLDIGENVTSIRASAFNGCTSLTKVIFRGLFLAEGNSSKIQFLNTPILNDEGYIYVPDKYLKQYKTATNWANWARRIKPISELYGIETGDEGGSGVNPEWTNWAYFSNGNNRNDLVAKLKYDDTANGKIFTSMIEGCSELTELPAINTAKGTNFGGMCKGCTGLVTIGGINVSGVKIAALLIDIFSNCTSLKYVTFEGEFPIKSNIDVFSTCPNLDETTLTHFLSVLANKTTSTKTVSIGSANLVKLTDEQINDVLTNKNIALA